MIHVNNENGSNKINSNVEKEGGKGKWCLLWMYKNKYYTLIIVLYFIFTFTNNVWIIILFIQCGYTTRPPSIYNILNYKFIIKL